MDTIHMLLREFGGMVLPCLTALPVILISRCAVYRKTGKLNIKHEAAVILFFLLLVAILARTVLPAGFSLRHPFSGYHLPTRGNTKFIIALPIGWIRWMLTLHNTAEIVRNIGGNILLFIPYGFLLPLAFPKVSKLTVLYGFLLSLFIETIQLFLDRVTDFNDIILNTFGVLIGYLLIRLIYGIINKRRRLTAGQERESS